MKNSNVQKSKVINQYIDAKVNVGNKGFLDASKVRPRVELEKEAVVASEMLLRNRASTSLASHGFISSVQPCVLASTKPLPTSSAAPFTNCRKRGFASYLERKESELSKYYTHVEIRYPRYKVIHNLMGIEPATKPEVAPQEVEIVPLSYPTILCQMQSISEDTTIAERKQIPFNKFLPTRRSGVWSDIGGCRDMEDTRICIADMAKNFGRSIRSEESISSIERAPDLLFHHPVLQAGS
ncbi:putative protein phosphatase 2C 54 [Capsicum baccatum]|uniref:Uncharacterized protein n=1 Tax=Capsicum baccatum TaxID=33114 RepID=A0A2G2VF20_CAPBA|nr:putative protein phosphatase 2C 54 [Capsicum baccatum]